MDVSSKNPAGGVDPARRAGWARRQGRVSLGYFSLHEQREVTRSCEAGAKALLSIFRFHAWPLAWPFDYRVGTDVQGKPEQGREQDQRLSLSFGARATFLCSCKETWPKESTPCLRARRATRAGSTPPPGFFDETSLSRRKTTCIPARRPSRGLIRRLRRCGREPVKSKAGATVKAQAATSIFPALLVSRCKILQPLPNPFRVTPSQPTARPCHPW